MHFIQKNILNEIIKKKKKKKDYDIMYKYHTTTGTCFW
jgi:hypothetical protein